MLYFEKADEVFYIVTTDTDTSHEDLQELYRIFKAEHPDKMHMKPYQNGIWDGYIRFFSFLDQVDEVALAPIGLFKKILNYMINYDIEFEIKNDDWGYPKQDLTNFDTWLEELEQGREKKISNRDYQYKGVVKSLAMTRNILVSPTGSGKSLMMYTYIMWILEHGLSDTENVLLVVPSTSLAEQMKGDFIEYGMDPEWISTIYYGQKKNFKVPVVISTWQSLYKYPTEFFDQFSALLVDEAHKAKSTELVYIGESCVNARYRLATTGTIQNNKALLWSIMANFGPVVTTKSTMELVDDGFLTDFYIRNIILNWKRDTTGRKKSFNIDGYDEELEAIITSKDRMTVVVNFIKNMWENREYDDGTLLVMGKRVQYIEDLYEELSEVMDEQIFFIHGGVSTELRSKIIAHVKIHGGIIIANINIMGTGINIPNVFGIIFANPIKSDISILQSIGRSIRLHASKSLATIFDIVDKIPTGNGDNTVYKWLAGKKETYNREDFKYDEVEVRATIRTDEDGNVL